MLGHVDVLGLARKYFCWCFYQVCIVSNR